MPVLDELGYDPSMIPDLAPEGRHIAGIAVPTWPGLNDVVKRHQPAVCHQSGVELEVSANAFVAVVAVDEEKVDLSSG